MYFLSQSDVLMTRAISRILNDVKLNKQPCTINTRFNGHSDLNFDLIVSVIKTPTEI